MPNPVKIVAAFVLTRRYQPDEITLVTDIPVPAAIKDFTTTDRVELEFKAPRQTGGALVKSLFGIEPTITRHVQPRMQFTRPNSEPDKE